jgi:arylsulfatase A-like enzyme
MRDVTRRTFLKQIPYAAWIATTLNVIPSMIVQGCSGKKKSNPNFILILTDDQGFGDIGVHGNKKIRTPNIDRLAAESMEFTQFYCNPVCAPTRASLLTGRYFYRTGIVHTSRGGAKMDNSEITIAELLGKVGYKTGIFGKWHLGDTYPMRPSEQGFQESLIHLSGAIGQAPDIPNSYFNPKLWHNNEPEFYNGYCTDIFTDAAINFIKKSKHTPFFAYIPYNAPHTPLVVNDAARQEYEKLGFSEDVARLYGMVTNIDNNLDRLFATIKKFNLEENTIVIFMSDNGPGGPRRFNADLHGRKGSTYDGGIRVPCYIRWPLQIEAGAKNDRITAHIDILPTIADILGIELPQNIKIDGISLYPLLKRENVKWTDRTLYFQFNRGMIPRLYQNCSARSQRYKLVSVYGSSAEIDPDSPQLKPEFELYDMSIDPDEKNNIAGKHPDILQKMIKGYEVWFKEMEESRRFEPGLIHIGSPQANPIRLCRYQDSSYINGIPLGWPVKIEKSGLYEISINRIGYNGDAQLFLVFDNFSANTRLFAGENKATFKIPAGEGLLKIWFEEIGKDKIVFTANHTIGDVDIRLLD